MPCRRPPLPVDCRLPTADSERESQVEEEAHAGRKTDTGTRERGATTGRVATEDMMDHLSLVPYDAGAGGGEAGGKYKECMRNHAAAMGGQAFDGCGEYMASSPDSLKCAACGCHRSFHRRAATGTAAALAGSSCAPPVFFRPPLALPAPPVSPQQQQHFHHHHHQAAAALQGFLQSVSVPLPVPAPPPPPHLSLPYHAVPNAAVAAPPPPWLATRAGSETPPRTDDFGIGVGVGFVVPGSSGGSGSFGRKRFRTKFTPEQKERMREFAEKQGWRIQRNDDGALDRFCDEIGVKRQVLKVWMHNHKNQLASTSAVAAAAAAAAGIGINPSAGAGTGIGITGDGDDEDTDDSPPRTAVSSPSPSPISV